MLPDNLIQGWKADSKPTNLFNFFKSLIVTCSHVKMTAKTPPRGRQQVPHPVRDVSSTAGVVPAGATRAEIQV